MAESLGSSVLDLSTDDSKLTRGLESAKQTVKEIGTAIGAAAGAAITAGAVEAIQREALNDKLAAQIALPPEQSKRAGTIAGKLYADGYGSSMEEVNSALGAIHTNIGELGSFSNAEITGMSEKALSLAKVFDIDVNRATRAAGQMMRNGLASDANEAFDLITVGMQNLDASLRDELIDTIEEYSTDFEQLGLTGPQVMGMIVGAVKSGARNTDIAADAIREFSIRAIDGSKGTTKAFKELGLDADGMAAKIAEGGPTAQKAMSTIIRKLGGVGNKVKQERIGVALFGTRFEEMGMEAIDALDPMSAEMDNVDGAAKRMGDTMSDNAQAKITKFRRAIETTLADLAQTPGMVGNAATAAAAIGLTLQPFGPMIVGVGLLFRGALTKMIAGLAKFAAKSSLFILRVIAKMTLLGVKALINAAKVALSWLIAMGPIALVVAAVVGLVALIIAKWGAIKKIIAAGWRWVKKTTSKLWKGIVKFLRGLWDGIKDKASAVWNGIKNAIAAVWRRVKNVTSSVWNGIKAFIRGAINRVKNAIDGLRTIAARVRRFFGRAKDAAVDKLKALIEWVKNLPQRIKNALGNLNRLLFDAGKAILQGLLDGIKNLWNRVKDFVSGIADWIREHKGPEQRDKVLLRPAGRWIMEGLQQGLESEMGALEATLGQVSASITGRLAGQPPVTGARAGITVQNLEVRAFTDRFNLRQVEDELALHGVR